MNYQTHTLQLDTGKCSGCGMCWEVCPHAVFALQNRKAVIQQPQACMECGACKRNCPTNAIQVDTGVGCAAALIQGALTKSEPQCGCSNEKPTCSCG